jgi:uroporphyrin-III C-methyltransferase/precorrin-2 dehydrogenase/sirohydrochlorin ferrochelatase
MSIEHDPKKWEPVFGKRLCSSKKRERDDDSKNVIPLEQAMNLALIAPDSPPRIAPLARLPVFLKLEGRRAVVAGASAAAAWKVELLAAAGATVDVYAPDPSTELLAVASRLRSVVNLQMRPWTPADFAEAAIAVGDCDDDAAATFAAAARGAGAPVNIIDKPALSDLAFGAIVNRSPLVIGISTDGAAPVFAQAIRARIETLIPHGFARWAEAAARWRPRVRGLGRALALRFWEKFAARAVAHARRPPSDAELEALLAESGGKRSEAAVVIIAPDDPELLTLRAVRALQSADVILFDNDIAAGIFDFARREARMLVDTSDGGDATADKQSQRGAMTIALSRAGRRVVRLVAGAAGSAGAQAEIAACRAAGVAVEVVPESGIRNQGSGISQVREAVP